MSIELPVRPPALPRRRRGHTIAAILLAAMTCVPAVARDEAPDPNAPAVGQAGKDVIWVPTPDALVERMLRMAEVTSEDTVVDLGAGDGRTVIAAAKQFRAKALGIEYNPQMVEHARRNLERSGVGGLARIEQGDIFVTDFRQATVVTMYLLTALNLKLRPTLMAMKPGTRLVSHQFSMGDWQPDDVSTIDGRPAYLWIVPANASGQWQLVFDGASSGSATMEIEQQYQKPRGSVRFRELQAALREPRLRGERLQFELMDEAGQVRSFDGRIQGNSYEGRVSDAKGRSSPFHATRQGAAPPIKVSREEAVIGPLTGR